MSVDQMLACSGLRGGGWSSYSDSLGSRLETDGAIVDPMVEEDT